MATVRRQHHADHHGRRIVSGVHNRFDWFISDDSARSVGLQRDDVAHRGTSSICSRPGDGRGETNAFAAPGRSGAMVIPQDVLELRAARVKTMRQKSARNKSSRVPCPHPLARAITRNCSSSRSRGSTSLAQARMPPSML